MAVLQAHNSVTLGPYPKGATLNITAPKTDAIANFPDLNGVAISLASVPKAVTLAQKNVYTLTARAANITYDVQQ